MKQAAKEVFVGNKSEYDQIKSIAKKYATKGKALSKKLSIF